MLLSEILEDIRAERSRQIDKFGWQSLPNGTSADYEHSVAKVKELCEKQHNDGTLEWLTVLTEEFLEAAAETDPVKLRAELIQVAAVAAAWVQDLDNKSRS
jgi:hypothetical protein